MIFSTIFSKKFTQKFELSRCNSSNFLQQKWVEPAQPIFSESPRNCGLDWLNSKKSGKKWVLGNCPYGF